jgi:hypothetical protein
MGGVDLIPLQNPFELLVAIGVKTLLRFNPNRDLVSMPEVLNFTLLD